MSVYREDDSGLAARLADRRAAWAASAAQVPATAQGAIVARSGRVWAGRVGVAVAALMIVGICASLLYPPAPYVSPPSHGHVDDGRALLLMVAVPFFSVLLFVGVVVAKLGGSMYGEHLARRRIVTLLAGDTSAMDPVRALAYLTEETPRRVLAAEAQRLERASVTLHLVTSPWATFMLVFMFLARFAADANGVWLDWTLFMGTAWALQGVGVLLTLGSLSQPGYWRSWQRDLVVTLSIVAAVAAFIGMPVTFWLLLVHVVTLGFRAAWVRGDVLRERAALC